MGVGISYSSYHREEITIIVSFDKHKGKEVSIHMQVTMMPVLMMILLHVLVMMSILMVKMMQKRG